MKKIDQSQEERVLQHQLAIAEAMKVSPEIQAVLQKIPRWEIREWLYICAVDGMECEQIGRLASERSVAKIQEARKNYFAKSKVTEGLRALEQEVRTVCQENREVRAAIEKGLIEEKQRQEKEYEEKLQSHEEILSRQRQTIIDLKEQLQTAEHYFQSLQKQKEEMQQSEEEKAPDTLHPEEGKRGIRAFFIRKRKKKEIRKFIEDFLQNDKLSEEQKEYLLTCLEEGERISDMEKYAAPGLSVSQMKRIRNLKGRNKRHA